MPKTDTAQKVKLRLVEVGGRTAQDLGVSRVAGQILVYLYLTDSACSLDQIGEDIGLSKAAVSIAARQLENLGLLSRVWKKGDRKNYYRTADSLGAALHHGLLAFLRQRVRAAGMELDSAADSLKVEEGEPTSAEAEFVLSRVKRAGQLQDRVEGILGSPLLDFLTRS